MANIEIIGEVLVAARYPVPGVRGTEYGPGEDIVFTGSGGFQTDHQWVIYNSSIDPNEKSNRIGLIRHNKEFADVEARASLDFLHLYLRDGSPSSKPWIAVSSSFAGKEPVTVNEYSDLTPCFDAGDVAAEKIADLLGIDEARLAVKSSVWLAGLVGPKPEERRVAPLHIVTTATLEAIGNRLSATNYDYRRFRPNIIIQGQGLDAHDEQDWVGKSLVLENGFKIEIDRSTKRCAVPGYDPDTGENLKDVPKVYDRSEEIDGKIEPVIGVYGHASVSLGDIASMRVFDTVYLNHGDEETPGTELLANR